MRNYTQLDLNYLGLMIFISLVSIGLQLGGADVQMALRFSHVALLQGEWWRFITGHLLHTGWVHLGMNLGAAFLLTLFLDRHRSLHYWILLWLLCMLGTSVGLYVWSPQVSWYVGLSGALHGVFVAVLAEAWCKGGKMELRLLVLAILAKVLWEQLQGPMPGSEASIGAPVVVDAHFYGSVTGLVISLVVLLWGFMAEKKNEIG